MIVNANLAAQDRATVEQFEAHVAEFGEVIEFRRVFGHRDYFIRIAVTSIATYDTFLTSKLMDTPGLATVDSHITMKTIKAND